MRLADDHSLRLSPSDLTAYLACPHLTTLSLEVALGERERPYTREALAQLVAEKGELHEARYLDVLREQGREVVEIELAGRVRRVRGGTRRDRRRRCATAQRSIYQATFSRDGWRGRADFLVRVDEPSDARRLELRAVRHEARALARRPAAVLQLAWYAAEIAAIQGRLPERLHVVLGTSEVESYRPADVDAYLRVGAAAPAGARRGAAGDVSVAVRALLPLRLHLGLPRSAGRTTTT